VACRSLWSSCRHDITPETRSAEIHLPSTRRSEAMCKIYDDENWPHLLILHQQIKSILLGLMYRPVLTRSSYACQFSSFCTISIQPAQARSILTLLACQFVLKPHSSSAILHICPHIIRRYSHLPAVQPPKPCLIGRSGHYIMLSNFICYNFNIQL